jgi:hypothetical protein
MLQKNTVAIRIHWPPEETLPISQPVLTSNIIVQKHAEVKKINVFLYGTIGPNRAYLWAHIAAWGSASTALLAS